MEYRFFALLAFLSVTLVASHGAPTPEEGYQKSVLPNTPIPNAMHPDYHRVTVGGTAKPSKGIPTPTPTPTSGASSPPYYEMLPKGPTPPSGPSHPGPPPKK